jgi:hypothetical protein
MTEYPKNMQERKTRVLAPAPEIKGYGSGSGIRILLSLSKSSKKNLDSYGLVSSF